MEATEYLSKRFLTESRLDGGYFTPLEVDWIYRFSIENGGSMRKEKLSGMKRIYLTFQDTEIKHVFLNKKKDGTFEISGDIKSRFNSFEELKDYLEAEI